jgi:hypothetical protein
MNDPVYDYFSRNIETVSKEELLTALENALKCAEYWREACLLGLSAVRIKSGTGTDCLSGKKEYTA